MLVAIIPPSCAKLILREPTPFLIDDGNEFTHDLIFLVAPLVLPESDATDDTIHMRFDSRRAGSVAARSVAHSYWQTLQLTP